MSKEQDKTKGIELKHIERVWADKGVVKLQDKKGNVRNMDVDTMVKRCQVVNRMVHKMPAWHQKNTLRVIEMVIQACREAKKQQKEDRIAAAVSNAPEGLDHAGNVLKMNSKAMDGYVSNLKHQLFTLTEDEIYVALQNPDGVPLPRIAKFLETVHKQRVAEMPETDITTGKIVDPNEL